MTHSPLDRLGCNALLIAHEGQVGLGRNLDIRFDNGYWIVNPRRVDKTAYIPRGLSDRPMQWTARFGSLTINGFHVDIPLGGMNERGLVVEHLAVESKYPERDERPALIPFQWVQYHLDTCETVGQVLQREPHVRLVGWLFEIMHFLVCDPSGDMAVIEYVKGDDGRSERRVYRGKDIPEHMTALGNATFAKHVEATRAFQGFGGTKPIPTDRSTLSTDTLNQFAYSSDRVRNYYVAPQADLVGYLFESLEVYTWDRTHLSAVYDPPGRTIHFVTSHNRTRRSIDLSGIDFSPAARKGLFWHDAPAPEKWSTDIAGMNRSMLDHFGEYGGFEAFASYRDELLKYRAFR